MTTERLSRPWCPGKLSISAVLLIALAPLLAADDTPKSAHFMARSIKNISPEQAIEYLVQTKLGTASRIPNTNTVLITAEPADLTKAKTLLELLDSTERYAVILLPAEPDTVSRIQNEQLARQLPDLSVGTFATPPGGQKPHVLVDMLAESVIVAAPADCIEQVLSALKQPSESPGPAQPGDANQPPVAQAEPAEPVGPPDANKLQDDRFFNQILDSLAEAEKVEAQLRTGGEETAAQAPELTEQARPAEQQETPSEPATESAAQPQGQPDLTKVIELVPKETGPAIKRLSYEPVPTQLADEQLELDLPETINVVDLIDLVGKYLKLNLLYDPAEVTGQVTVRVQDKIKVGELYPLLESVLKFRGFAMTRKDNLVTIVPIDKVLETDPVLFDTEEKQLRFGNVIITRVFNLRYIDTGSAENLLNDMKLGAHIKGIPAARKLIVTDYAYRMNRVEELLTIIDRPGEIKQFRYRQLRYTMARSLADQVKTLAEQLGTLTITVAAAQAQAEPAVVPTRGRRPAPRPTPQPTAPTAESAQPAVYLDADERTNRILMIGTPEQLDIVETLINSLDVAQQDLRTLRLYDIQYAGADEVVEKLQALGIISTGKRITAAAPTPGRITAPQQPQAAEPAPVATVLTEEGLVEEPQVVIIESTNSLLVNATAEQHAQIAVIIAYVDAEPEQSATNYVVYPLENQDPEVLAAVLKQLIEETVEEQQQGQDSKVVRTTRKKPEEDITIIAEPTTYSIVVYGSKKNQQWIASLIDQLDKRRPQVLIDVTLVEISKNDEFNYDLNVISSFPDLINTSGLTGVIKTVQGSAPITTSDIITKSSRLDKSRFIDLQSKSGSGTAFYGDRHIMALLEAVQSKNYGRVLARPKLLVNDNEQGTIEAKETTYRTRTETSTVPVGGTNEVVLTEQTIFDAYDAGIALAIKPHISEGQLLKLEITLTRSDFRDTEASLRLVQPTPPDRVTSDVTTIITVPDKSTIILGGLERLNQAKGGSKVPLLGDIPLVGGLFRGIANTDNQSRLYVFVKAHIIRPEEKRGGRSDVEVISGKNRATFEKYEREMQEYEDWPGIKPQPMDPLKVLEDD